MMNERKGCKMSCDQMRVDLTKVVIKVGRLAMVLNMVSFCGGEKAMQMWMMRRKIDSGTKRNRGIGKRFVLYHCEGDSCCTGF
jgi:hypothetical protein